MRQHLQSVGALIVVAALGAPVAAAQDVSPAAAPAPAAAQESESTRAAATLIALLEERKLDAVAARDPGQPGNVVAAFYVAGTQLLVVSAPYPSTAIFDKRVAEGKYMDIYLDLNATKSREGQFFVMDLEANGLRRVCDRDQPFDSTSRNGGSSVSFDGNWAGQQLTEADYQARFEEDDARYAGLLKALSDALRPNRLTMK
jgi:hypothetical protein